MSKTALVVPLLLAFASVRADYFDFDRLENLTPIQKEVLLAIENRWQAWADDDLEKYLAAHHPSWERWSARTSSLEGTDEVPAFWRRAKDAEATLDFEIIPLSIEVFSNGQMAAVHYVANERIRLLKDRSLPGGRVNLAGKENLIQIRFSDFLILRDGNWLLVGGYKDGNCSLFHGFGRLCSNE